MPESLKMIIVLTVIAGSAGLALSAMNKQTEPMIKENVRLFTLSSINKVLPDTDKPDPCKKFKPIFDNAPDADVVCVDGFKIYRGRKGEEIIGLAIESIGDKSYDGTILTLLGFDNNDTLTGIEVLKHKETPGLGSLIENCEWQSQMVGNNPTSINWTVTKDGGDVDQLSGATISSRSMLDSIHKAHKLLSTKRQEILNATPMAEGEVCNGK